MERFHHPGLIAGLFVSALTFGAGAAEHAHWSYSSATGPAHWAALDPDNQLCKSGFQQSPIGLKTRESKRLNEHDISIHYALAKGQWVN